MLGTPLPAFRQRQLPVLLMTSSSSGHVLGDRVASGVQERREERREERVHERMPLLKSNSMIFGAGPITVAFPNWIATFTIIVCWCVASFCSLRS